MLPVMSSSHVLTRFPIKLPCVSIDAIQNTAVVDFRSVYTTRTPKQSPIMVQFIQSQFTDRTAGHFHSDVILIERALLHRSRKVHKQTELQQAMGKYMETTSNHTAWFFRCPFVLSFPVSTIKQTSSSCVWKSNNWCYKGKLFDQCLNICTYWHLLFHFNAINHPSGRGWRQS